MASKKDSPRLDDLSPRPSPLQGKGELEGESITVPVPDWRPGEPFDPSKFLKSISRFNNRTKQTTIEPYLGAGPRLAWFRSDHPIESLWKIKTVKEFSTDGILTGFEAFVVSPEDVVVGNAFAPVENNDVRKAETDARSRVLAVCGYGGAWEIETSGEEPPARNAVPEQKAPKVVAPSETEIHLIGEVRKRLATLSIAEQQHWRRGSVQLYGAPIELLRGADLSTLAHDLLNDPEVPAGPSVPSYVGAPTVVRESPPAPPFAVSHVQPDEPTGSIQRRPPPDKDLPPPPDYEDPTSLLDVPARKLEGKWGGK